MPELDGWTVWRPPATPSLPTIPCHGHHCRRAQSVHDVAPSTISPSRSNATSWSPSWAIKSSPTTRFLSWKTTRCSASAFAPGSNRSTAAGRCRNGRVALDQFEASPPMSSCSTDDAGDGRFSACRRNAEEPDGAASPSFDHRPHLTTETVAVGLRIETVLMKESFSPADSHRAVRQCDPSASNAQSAGGCSYANSVRRGQRRQRLHAENAF